MAKLYFRHGTVGSAKTLNLLAVAHNYAQQGKRALIVKPALDDRFGRQIVQSRSGMKKKADLVVETDSDIDEALLAGVHCILVDEAQFLSEASIEKLRAITRTHDVPVICYGLRTDFRTRLFEGSRRLLELADAIEEVKTTCHFCNRKAVFNLRLQDGIATLDGPSVELGAEEKYLPSCARCYHGKLQQADRC